jgi:hypothetical protein
MPNRYGTQLIEIMLVKHKAMLECPQALASKSACWVVWSFGQSHFVIVIGYQH